MLIYRATNTRNGKAYIGLTEDLHKRKTEHLCLANRGYQYHFHKAIRHHGFDSFVWETLEKCDSRDAAAQREVELIAEHDTFNNGYNGTEGGHGGFKARHTDETKRKISETLRGRFKGKLNQETRQKMSKSAKRRAPASVETRAKISAAGIGNKNGGSNKGKKRYYNLDGSYSFR